MTVNVRADGRYEVTIKRSTFGGGAAYRWTVVAPDGRFEDGDTYSPAWLWVARWSARRAARRLMLQARNDGAVAHYFLRPKFAKDTDDE